MTDGKTGGRTNGWIERLMDVFLDELMHGGMMDGWIYLDEQDNGVTDE